MIAQPLEQMHLGPPIFIAENAECASPSDDVVFAEKVVSPTRKGDDGKGRRKGAK
jgi:hypothetical protein